MFQLVESICIENKELKLIDLHNQRLNRSLQELFACNVAIDLAQFIQIPTTLNNQRYKCRVTTNDGQNFEYEIIPYQQRTIQSLQIVHCKEIDYHIKTTERNKLDELFAKRQGSDDILIVRNELLTDSWAANILLYDGIQWVTPQEPLLKGVQREHLLQLGKISEQHIPVDGLIRYHKIKLVNAMIDFDRAPEIEIKHVNF
jgi:4-amino-4-deoxychorismate lyase